MSCFFSCSGVVVNLNGKPVSQSVVIRAEGVQGEDCINTEESSQAEPSGYFRVRGLKVNMHTQTPERAIYCFNSCNLFVHASATLS